MLSKMANQTKELNISNYDWRDKWETNEDWRRRQWKIHMKQKKPFSCNIIMIISIIISICLPYNSVLVQYPFRFEGLKCCVFHVHRSRFLCLICDFIFWFFLLISRKMYRFVLMTVSVFFVIGVISIPIKVIVN